MVSLSQSDTYRNRKKEVINITPKSFNSENFPVIFKVSFNGNFKFWNIKTCKIFAFKKSEKNLKKTTQMLYEFQRNGADFSVFVNTAAEFDGSDAGASPDEAVSWGKIKKTAKPVKVSRRCLFIPKQMNSSSINTMY